MTAASASALIHMLHAGDCGPSELPLVNFGCVRIVQVCLHTFLQLYLGDWRPKTHSRTSDNRRVQMPWDNPESPGHLPLHLDGRIVPVVGISCTTIIWS